MVLSALYALKVSQRIDMYKNYISLNKSQVELIELQHSVLVRQDLLMRDLFPDCFQSVLGK